MGVEAKNEGELKLKVGPQLVRVRYRRPEPAELLSALVKEMPRGEEEADAQRILMANLELGQACITGIGEGDLVVHGQDLAKQDGRGLSAWKELLAKLVPLILIALGQFLSQVPEVISEHETKKSSGMPG